MDNLDRQFGPGAEDALSYASFQEKIMEDILTERTRQLSLRIGGNTSNFDQTNTKNDWIAYIVAYAGRAAECLRNEKENQDFRINMIKVAALAMAAIEAHDQGWC